MKLKARLALFLLGFGLLLGFNLEPQPVIASTDLVFTCKAYDCELDQSSQPMFQEENIQPGQVFTQRLTVRNSSAELGRVYLRFSSRVGQEQLSLAKVMIVSVEEIDANKVGGHQKFDTGEIFLASLLNQPRSLPLGPILPQTDKSFLVKFKLDEQANNSFQNKLVRFDISFSLDFLGVLTPTPSIFLQPTTPLNPHSFIPQTTSSPGQVLGAATKAKPRLQLKREVRKNPWLKRWAPIFMAGLSMLSLLGVITGVWWLVFLRQKRRSDNDKQ